MGARWYDPALGRFIQPDTILPQQDDPQQLNRFSWVRNNPLKYTDPSGHRVDPGEGGDTDPNEAPPWYQYTGDQLTYLEQNTHKNNVWDWVGMAAIAGVVLFSPEIIAGGGELVKMGAEAAWPVVKAAGPAVKAFFETPLGRRVGNGLLNGSASAIGNLLGQGENGGGWEEAGVIFTEGFIAGFACPPSIPGKPPVPFGTRAAFSMGGNFVQQVTANGIEGEHMTFAGVLNVVISGAGGALGGPAAPFFSNIFGASMGGQLDR